MIHILETQGIETLRRRLDHFYTSFIDRLQVSNLDLVSTLNGICFLSINKTSYTSILSFVHDMESRYPNISLKSTLVTWKHYLVWCGLPNLQDAKPLYDYITDPETGKVADNMINQVKGKGEAIVSSRPTNLNDLIVAGGASNKLSSPASKVSAALQSLSFRPEQPKFNGYLVGPVDPTQIQSASTVKRVFIGLRKKEMGLLIYQNGDCTVTLLFDEPAVEVDSKFYMDLKQSLDKRLPALNTSLHEEWAYSRKMRYKKEIMLRIAGGFFSNRHSFPLLL